MMNSTEKNIIEYLRVLIHGVINIGLSHAQKIINIVNGEQPKHYAFVKLHEKDFQSKTWKLKRTIQTTDEEVDVQIKAALEQQPNFDFYMYECYGSDAKFQGHIYTSQQFLFD